MKTPFYATYSRDTWENVKSGWLGLKSFRMRAISQTDPLPPVPSPSAIASSPMKRLCVMGFVVGGLGFFLPVTYHVDNLAPILLGPS